MRALLDRLPFAVLLALRTHFTRHRALTLLTLGAVAMSVALATALEMASRSVEQEMMRTADELAGAAELEVTGGGTGVPEELLPAVRGVPGVDAAVPFTSASVRVAEGEASGRGLHILGVDLLSDRRVRDYNLADGQVSIDQPLRLLARADSVLVAETLARTLELEAGDALRVRAAGERQELRVRGVLKEGGVADAFGGQVAVMDVYSLQTFFGRPGWLDRIDVVLEPGAELDVVRAALIEAVGGRASVRRSAIRDTWVEATLSTVRLVVWSLVAVAVLVAVLLSYGATALFVERRAGELAMLRAAGLEATRVERLLHVDALLLGLFGSGLGVGLGLLLSRAFVDALSSLTSLLDGVEIEGLAVSGTTLLIAALVGSGVALFGSLGPARVAARRPPLEVLAAARGPEPPAADGALRRLGLPAGVAGLWIASVFAPLPAPPLVRVGVIVVLGLLTLALAAQPLLEGLFRIGRPALERTMSGVGLLVGETVRARPGRTALTVAAVAGVLAAVTVGDVLSRSVSRTLDEWTAAQYPGGVMVTAGEAFTFRATELVAPETVRTIRETSGVEAVFQTYATNILYRGEEVLLVASNMEVMAERGRMPVAEGDPQEVAWAIAEGGIGVSDSFAHRFDVGVGDTLTLKTPQGPRDFRVAGILHDYAGPAGSLNIQIDLYDELWSREGARNLVLWTQRPVEPVLEAIRSRVGEAQILFFVHGEELARYASRLFGRFGTLIDLVAGLTALLGGFAVLNLLLGAVMERRRELSLLRSTGATSGQIAALVLTDGLITGVVGALGGIGLGLACAWPMVEQVLPAAYGWNLDFVVDPARLLLFLAGVGVASLLAGLYPVIEALRILPREVFAPE